MKTPHSDLADEQILALMQAGNNIEKGFRLLMEKYQERLYWQVRRLVYDHDDSNDVLQNCFIKIFRSLHTFEGKSKLYTWLYRIAVNEAITFINRKKQRYAASIENGPAAFSEQLRADPYFDGDEASIRLQEAILRLPEKQRIVFNLRYFDEMSYADMSEILETSEGALKASFHHAVKKIETHMRGGAIF